MKIIGYQIIIFLFVLWGCSQKNSPSKDVALKIIGENGVFREIEWEDKSEKIIEKESAKLIFDDEFGLAFEDSIPQYGKLSIEYFYSDSTSNEIISIVCNIHCQDETQCIQLCESLNEVYVERWGASSGVFGSTHFFNEKQYTHLEILLFKTEKRIILNYGKGKKNNYNKTS